jgi:hypothetical protein
MMITSNRAGVLISILIGLIYLSFYHGAMMGSPNSYQFNVDGDAMKAYYTLAYHVSHDTSYWHFDGMNHPYGDHLHYPDAQPVLANTLKALSVVAPSIKNSTVGCVNAYVLLGLLLGLPFLFLLYRELGVGWGLALCIAFAAWILNPQTMRVHGHFGLAHCWVIPAVIWAYLRGRRSPGAWRYPLVLLTSILIAIWTHPYLAIIAIAPIWVYSFLNAAIHKKAWNKQEFLLLGLSVVPLLLFLMIDSLGPDHPGRSEYPLGFFDNRTTLYNLVSALKDERSPLHRVLIPQSENMTIEGLCYLGAGVLFIPVALISLFRGRAEGAGPDVTLVLVLFASSFLLLLYAMGVPFIWDLKRFIWKLPLLDEFRSAGRFSWPFYFMSFGLIAVALERQFQSGRSKRLLWGVVGVILMFQTYEAHYVKKSLARNLKEVNLFNPNSTPEQFTATVSALNARSDLTAFIPLPFFHYGSGAVLTGDFRAQGEAMVVSFHTGLPMMASAIAKASISEARNITSLYNPAYYGQPLREEFNPNTQIALVAFRSELPEHDQALLDAAGELHGTDEGRVSFVNARALFRRDDLLGAAELLRIHDSDSADTQLMKYNGDTALFFDFDAVESNLVLRGSGSYLTNYGEYESIIELNPHPFDVGKEYVLSFWCDNSRATADGGMYVISQEAHKGAGEHWDFITDGRRARIRWNGASFVELPFTCTHNGIFRFYVSHPNYYPNRALIDDVLIREKSDTVTFFSDRDYFWNGMLIPVIN